jgi:hypothetical protein
MLTIFNPRDIDRVSSGLLCQPVFTALTAQPRDIRGDIVSGFVV